MSEATRNGDPDDSRVVRITDDYGNRRRLVKCQDCDCYEGLLDSGAGLEPYWLPASVVEQWRNAPPLAPQGDSQVVAAGSRNGSCQWP